MHFVDAEKYPIILEAKAPRGSVVVWNRWLDRRIGPWGRVVWSKLCGFRDRYGAHKVFIGQKALAKDLGLKRKHVEKVLGRLYRAGLVSHDGPGAGFRPQEVAGGERVLVFARRVHGKARGQEATEVPFTAFLATRKLTPKGGRRRGAGRPPRPALVAAFDSPGGVPADAENARKTGGIGAETGGAFAGGVANQKGVQGRSPEEKSKGGTNSGISNSVSLGSRENGSSSKEEERRLTPPQFFAEKLPEAVSVSALPVFAPASASPVPAVPVSEVVGEGSFSAARAAPTAPRPAPGCDGIPRVPDCNLCPSVFSPPPPLLDPTRSNLEWAEDLARAYRGAVATAFGLKRPVLASLAQLRKSKLLPGLVEAAKVLYVHEIPPAAWAAWSCAKWKEYVAGRNGKRVGAPRVSWVFNAGRVAEKHGWYHSECAQYEITRATAGPVLADLRARHRKMLDEVHKSWCGGEGPDAFAAIAARWFPAGAFDEEVGRAQQETKRIQEEQQRQVQHGAWIWTWWK